MSQELRELSPFNSDPALPGNASNPHGFAARAAGLRPSPELSALRGVLFRVLDSALGGSGSIGPLQQAWLNSPGISLQEALGRLNQAERTRLAQNLGADELARLNSLMQERDAEMLAEQLLHLAYRWEEAGHPVQAVAVYQAFSHSAPSEAFRDRAAARLATLGGMGSDGDQAEFFLRNLTQELTRPEMLGSMLLAGTAFRLTRLGTLEGLLARPAGLWTRGLGAQALAGSLGFLSESTVFTLSAKGLSEWIRGPQDWALASLGREFASTVLTLGALRLTGWSSQRLFNRALDIGPAGLAPGTDLLTRFSHQALPQVSMLGGLMLAQSLESSVGLQESRSPGQILRSSLMLWAQFNLAGALTRGLMGPEFARWEQGLDLRAEALQSGGGPRPASRPWLKNWMQNFGPREFVTSHGIRLPAPSGGEVKAEDLTLHMSGSGDGGGDSGRPKSKREPTLPFITLRATGGSDPLRVESMLQLMRRMNEPELRFKERLLASDVDFTLTAPFLDNLPTQLGPIVSFLEVISRRLELPPGRRVRIIAEGTSETVELVKTEHSFETRVPARFRAKAEASTPPAELSGADAPTAPSSSVPPAEEGPGRKLPSPVPDTAPPRSAPGEANTIPSVVNQLERLSLLIRTSLLTRNRESGPRLIILEGVEAGETELNQVLRSINVRQEENEVQFRLLLPRGRKIYFSQRSADDWIWREASALTWQNIESQTNFGSEVQVRNAEEMYQAAVTFADAKMRDTSQDMSMKWLGLTPPDRRELSHFLRQALDYYRVPGKALRLFLPEETEPRLFTGSEGRWSFIDPEPRAGDTGPPTPPPSPTSPPKAEETPSLRAEGAKSSEPPPLSPKRSLAPSSQIPLVHNMGLTSLISTLRNSVQNVPPGEQPRPVILERSQLFDSEPIAAVNGVRLNHLTKALARELDPHWELRLFVPESERTFIGRRKGEVMSWNTERASTLSFFRMKVRVDPIEIENLAELYPLMRSFVEVAPKPSPTGRNLQLLTPLPEGAGQELQNFVVRCLNGRQVQERQFHLSTPRTDQHFYFINEMGHWRVSETPLELPAVPEPGTGSLEKSAPTPPPPRDASANRHFAKVREIFGNNGNGGEEIKAGGDPEGSKENK